jgi:DNA-binding response OmpR family regulator
VARIALVCPDLLFGSKIQGALTAAGHEVELLRGADAARAAAATADLFVVDLNAEELDGADLVAGLRGAPDPVTTPALGFYAHTDVATRRRAEAAGFDTVVPRSRMAREGPALADRLLAART